MIAVLIFLGVLIFVLLIKGFKIIKQAEVMVIERLGKYNKTLNSGLNFIIPFVDAPRYIEIKNVVEGPGGQSITYRERRERVDLREVVYDFPKQNVITKDNVVIEINALIYFQITDPVKAVYEIANLSNAIEKLTQTTLRNIIGELDLDQTLASRDTINSKLKTILDEATDKWGVKVNRVELQDINPPKEIKEAMEKQMRAERDKRAVILEAEGSKQSKILEAEGYKEAEINRAEGQMKAKILQAQGEAEAKIRVAEAESQAIKKINASVEASDTSPTQYLIALKYIETLKEMTTGKENKVVYMPYEATGILGAVGSLKDLFKNS